MALSGIKCNLPFSSKRTPAETMTMARQHTAKLAQDWIATNCSIDEWPQNSSHLSLLDYHVWGAMLERSQKISTSSRKFCSRHGTRCDRQNHVELTEKTSALCRCWWRTSNICWNGLFNDLGHEKKLHVSVDYSVQNWKYGITYLTSRRLTLEKTEIWSKNRYDSRMSPV